jgi:REP element-mobilizing transposase RayT
MARPLRIHIPLKLYHVRSRGNDRRPLFEDDYDHLKYLELIARAVDRFKVRCLAYCLMTNHVHLLLQPTDHSVSRFMQQIGSSFAHWANRRHGRTGHLVEGRFKGSLVENSVYYLRVLRYIARNPVAAKMVDGPDKWAWSSYRATAGLTVVPPFLDVKQVWGTFDKRSRRHAQEQYRFFVSSDVDDDEDFAGLLVGSATFVQSLEPNLAPHRTNRELTYRDRFCTRPSLESIFDGRPDGPVLHAAVRKAFVAYAYTLREIGEHLGRPPSTIWAWVQRASDDQ